MSTSQTVEGAASVLPCVGCGGLVPNVDGPTHPYMAASPGCWRVYGEVSARSHREPGPPAVHWYQVDCYAAQHPGGAEHDRRQRQSVAVHLTSLCLLLEHGMPAVGATTRRGRMSQTVLPRIGLPDWPYLVPPASHGAVTVVDVHHTTDQTEYAVQVKRWAEAVWTAWSGHHHVVRQWASTALGGPA